MYKLSKILLLTTALASVAGASEVPLTEDQVPAVEKTTSNKPCVCNKAGPNQVKARLSKFADHCATGMGSRGCSCDGSSDLNGTSNCDAVNFVFKVKGSNDFSFGYASNQDFFKLAKGLPKIDVLVDASGKDIESSYNGDSSTSGTVNGVKALSDGGVLGDYTRSTDLFNEHKLSIEARRTLGSFAYGGLLEAEFSRKDAVSADNAYVFFETGYGRFEMGRITDSAVEPLRIDASSIAAVGGGFGDLNWTTLANLEGRPIGATHSTTGNGDSQKSSSTRHRDAQRPFLVHANYYTAYNNPLRANFITTGLGNLRMALGYTNSTADGTYHDIIDVGAGYAGKKGNLKYAISFSGQAGLSTPTGDEHHPLRRFEVGASVQLHTIKLAGSWGSTYLSGVKKSKDMQLDLTKAFADSSQLKKTDGDSTYMTFGATYEEGPVMFSLGYMESYNTFVKSVGVNTLRVVSLGTHYRITGSTYELTPYINTKCFMAQEAGIKAEDNNKGFVLASGVKVSY
ncbi:porin [Neorickettsia sennetsu]|uniref:51 kDa major antigen n=3 Tax=Ehrlichia sennetsu TaxID=951 RepID=Q2GEG0_EHRS3|nr:porin [Neorickettsia sennetsu]AAL79559.1 51 kDa antigen [Neorickettsia sennetsu]AAL79561.1 51 kDa antigen [Neorickettsia sennetsu]AAR23990.1 51 kDa antigen [Neorickettsia sennetsu]ABD46251.1 51 kDa major antigen [Neorickettsia sennetsu str. Miyayama]